MIFGYNSLPYQVNIPGWSLDMEMQFYLIAPILVFLVSKNIFVVFLFALGSLFSQKLGGSTTVAPFLYFFAIGAASARYNLKPNSGAGPMEPLSATLVVLVLCAGVLVKDIMLGEPHLGAAAGLRQHDEFAHRADDDALGDLHDAPEVGLHRPNARRSLLYCLSAALVDSRRVEYGAGIGTSNAWRSARRRCC